VGDSLFSRLEVDLFGACCLGVFVVAPMLVSEVPKRLQGVPKRSQDSLKSAPRGSRRRPRVPHEAPRGHQKIPRAGQEGSKGLLAAKLGQVRSKMLLKTYLYRKRECSRNVACSF